MTKRYCLTLDLKDDLTLIAEYKRHYDKIWSDITESIKDAGIERIEIYLLGTRLCMVMGANEHFSFEKKAQFDRDNPKVQAWENLMLRYQQPWAGAPTGEKWQLMERIFELEA